MRLVRSLFFILCLFPWVTEAAVTINEIAWMGDSTSANYEWIELYNDGGAVTVDGWTLSDGGNLNIELVGSIASGEYVVLERTSDASAPGTAFLTYTGALVNTGATLSLRRADNGLEDQVSGGEDWENIGGDNTTKETAQYTPSGWVTAVATPGSANAAEQPEASGSNEENSSKDMVVVKSKSGGTPTLLKLPGNILELTISAPKTVFVNQSVEFDVESGHVGDTIEDSLQYQWNFGDVHTSQQKAPEHSFSYPGTYVVSVRAKFATQDSMATHEITVLPVNVSLTKNSAGDIQINNDSPYAVDLSDYRLRAGEAIDLPDNTWLLSRQTITVPYDMVDASNNTLVALYDNYGEMLSSMMPNHLAQNEIENLVEEIAPRVQGRITPVAANSNFNFVSQVEAADYIEVESVEEAYKEPKPVSEEKHVSWVIVAFITLLSIGCVVVLMQPLGKTGSLDSHEGR